MYCSETSFEMFEFPHFPRPRLAIPQRTPHHWQASTPLADLTRMRVARQPGRPNPQPKCTTFNTRFFSHNDVHFFHCFSIFKSEHGAAGFDVVNTHSKRIRPIIIIPSPLPHYGHGFTNTNGRIPFYIALQTSLFTTSIQANSLATSIASQRLSTCREPCANLFSER
jgi:hypothetical protein